MSRASSAVELMAARKVNCAQAVLTAFCGEFGLDTNLALKLAQGFGGGMGRTGQTCGAVSGAYMVIGLMQRTAEDSPENKDRVYQLIRDFTQKFTQRHGSTLCKGLLGYDVGKPEEMEIVKQKGLLTSLCPNLVRDAIEIVEG